MFARQRHFRAGIPCSDACLRERAHDVAVAARRVDVDLRPHNLFPTQRCEDRAAVVLDFPGDHFGNRFLVTTRTSSGTTISPRMSTARSPA